MSSAWRKLQNQNTQLSTTSSPQVQNSVANDRIEVIKKLNEKLECFNFENMQNLKKLHEKHDEILDRVKGLHEDVGNHHDNMNDLNEIVQDLGKKVDENDQLIKSFRDEVYSVIEEYLVCLLYTSDAADE